MCLVRGRDVTIRRVIILIAVNCTTQMRRKEFARIISGYWHALRVATFQRCFQTPRLICHILRWPRHFARQLMSLYCLASLFTILFNFGLSSRLSILDRCALIEINANRDISAKHDSCRVCLSIQPHLCLLRRRVLLSAHIYEWFYSERQVPEIAINDRSFLSFSRRKCNNILFFDY